MKINRELQHRILSTLADIHPNGTFEVANLIGASEDVVVANLIYLAEHGLVVSGYVPDEMARDNELQFFESQQSRITATGLDFLAADGGLSAILKVVTFRLEPDQFAELLASRIEKLQNVSQEERSELAKAIRKLPATAIEKVSSKMLDWAVDHAGDALPLLRTLLGLA